MERRLDVFVRASADAKARLSAYDDSLARARRMMQMVTVAPFRMRVENDLIELATRAAEIARDDLASAGSAFDRVTRREFVVRSEIVRWGVPRENIPSVVVAVVDSNGVERRPIWGPVDDAKMLATWLRQHALQVLAWDLDRSFRAWIDATPVFDSMSTEGWTMLRLQLVSSPATIAHRCFEQDLQACAKVLGLTATADTVQEWFDAKARRKLVERHQAEAFNRRTSALSEACVAGNDSACVGAMRSGEVSMHARLAAHRASLVQYAIQVGGAGALERLFDPARSPAERIERVARVSTDSLLSGWIRRVRETRVPSADLTPAISLLSLAWIGIFGALALRNSRWR